MEQLRTLDLSIPHPNVFPDFYLDASSNASYNSDQKSWWIHEIGGFIRFRIFLAEIRGFTINLRLRGFEVSGKSDSPITLSVNGQTIVETFEPETQTFSNRSWFVPSTFLKFGDNAIMVQLLDGTAAVFLQAFTVMNYMMQPQLQQAWCWSAVSASTALYYQEKSPWTQCELVNVAFNRTGCCEDGSSPECNQPWYLEKGLTITGNLSAFIEGPQPIEAIQKLIDANMPVAARIGWQGVGHFVVITGVGADQTMVAIQDSYFGPSYITYESLVNYYKGLGKWTHTYLTRSGDGK
ncbi:MAG: papain-like cysteine protease family protein [Candidatus Omnitrophota bacterium]